jgi:hypothetical protein
VAVSGCYGSTEPAGNISRTAATLRGFGTANNGPVTVRFEYWQTAHPSDRQLTEPKHIPGGARGPVSAEVTGLEPETSYSFRMCGSDDADGKVVCAQTRSFVTIPPEDSVVGEFLVTGLAQGTIDAHSGPNGENPHGHVHFEGDYDLWQTFDGEVSCLLVRGNKAAIGVVGEGTRNDGGSNPRSGTLLLAVTDGGTGDQDSITGFFAQGSEPPDCESISLGGGAVSERDLVVVDN